MPGHAVVVLVVQDGETGLVMELLQALDGDADVVLGINGSLLDSLIVIRLRLSFPEWDQVMISTFQPDSSQLTLQSCSRKTCLEQVCQSEQSCRC